MAKNNKEEFALNELVFGQVRGYPWWPGYIHSNEPNSDYKIVFFGDFSYSMLNSKKIKRFETTHRKIDRKNDKLVQAVASALRVSKGETTVKEEHEMVVRNQSKIQVVTKTKKIAKKRAKLKKKRDNNKNNAIKKSNNTAPIDRNVKVKRKKVVSRRAAVSKKAISIKDKKKIIPQKYEENDKEEGLKLINLEESEDFDNDCNEKSQSWQDNFERRNSKLTMSMALENSMTADKGGVRSVIGGKESAQRLFKDMAETSSVKRAVMNQSECVYNKDKLLLERDNDIIMNSPRVLLSPKRDKDDLDLDQHMNTSNMLVMEQYKAKINKNKSQCFSVSSKPPFSEINVEKSNVDLSNLNDKIIPNDNLNIMTETNDINANNVIDMNESKSVKAKANDVIVADVKIMVENSLISNVNHQNNSLEKNDLATGKIDIDIEEDILQFAHKNNKNIDKMTDNKINNIKPILPEMQKPKDIFLSTSSIGPNNNHNNKNLINTNIIDSNTSNINTNQEFKTIENEMLVLLQRMAEKECLREIQDKLPAWLNDLEGKRNFRQIVYTNIGKYISKMHTFCFERSNETQQYKTVLFEIQELKKKIKNKISLLFFGQVDEESYKFDNYSIIENPSPSKDHTHLSCRNLLPSSNQSKLVDASQSLLNLNQLPQMKNFKERRSSRIRDQMGQQTEYSHPQKRKYTETFKDNNQLDKGKLSLMSRKGRAARRSVRDMGDCSEKEHEKLLKKAKDTSVITMKHEHSSKSTSMKGKTNAWRSQLGQRIPYKIKMKITKEMLKERANIVMSIQDAIKVAGVLEENIRTDARSLREYQLNYNNLMRLIMKNGKGFVWELERQAKRKSTWPNSLLTLVKQGLDQRN